MNGMLSRGLIGVATAVSLVGTAAAADLTIGLASLASSADPHWHNLGNNNGQLTHIYSRLVGMDEKQRIIPDLAESWGPIDDLTWEFKLRQDVTWHDGTPFTADDVIFTMARAGEVPNSPSSFGAYTSGKEFIKVDDYTVHVKTATPYPLMANDLSTVMIVSKKHGEGASTDDYNAGTAVVGTGPYKFVEYRPGDTLIVEANEDYFGGRPEWDRVVIREINSGQARVAALLAGDVDLISQVPTVDVERLKSDPDVEVSSGVSNRVIYLHLDRKNEAPVEITDKQGNALGKNPFHDLKVRQAISKAINRDGIVARIMEGLAIPAGQVLPEGFFGVSPNLQPEPYDPEGAKALLAEAGYPEGFGITLHGPNDRYVNDAKIVEAIAQMLTRVGIDTKVQTEPKSTYFSNAWDYNFILVGWGSGTGEPSSPLRALLATQDKEKGMGRTNRGGYSNPAMDAILEEALATVDDDKRAQLLAEATEVAIGDLGIIPLHYQVNSWGTRKGLAYTPRTDEYTFAMSVEALMN
ncbi:MAG: ABC transporter substrate-binding protein [Alphaproteobacteria bacterium]